MKSHDDFAKRLINYSEFIALNDTMKARFKAMSEEIQKMDKRVRAFNKNFEEKKAKK